MTRPNVFDVGEPVWVVEGSPPGCRAVPGRVVSDGGEQVCYARDAGGGVAFAARARVFVARCWAEASVESRNAAAALVRLVPADGFDTDTQEGE